MRPDYPCLTVFSVLWIFAAGCAGLARQDKSPDQIAAEKALTGKKTALLERENQVLRDENLELTRSSEMLRADLEKKRAEFAANETRRSAELKAAEASIANLTQKIAILESESGGKIKQLTQLNDRIIRNTRSKEDYLREKNDAIEKQKRRNIEICMRVDEGKKQFVEACMSLQKVKEVTDIRRSGSASYR